MSLGTRRRQVEIPSAVRDRARQAASQIGPVAKSAQRGAADRIHTARTWVAPRIEQAARSVQRDVAPKVSGILEATAHRVEPAQKSAATLGRRARAEARKTSRDVRARRAKMLAKSSSSGKSWQKMGGLAFLVATVGAIVTVVMRRRNGGGETPPEGEGVTSESQAPADAEASDGQVRTS